MTDPRDQSARPIESEEFALLVDSIQDYAIFLLSPEGVIRSWNAGAARIMGYEAEEAIGKHFSLVYGPADVAAAKPDRELAVAAEEGRIEDEGWRIRKGGSRFWVNTVITALRNPDGSVKAFAKVTRDLTQRREADETLRQSEEMFRLLVSSVKDYAIFFLDATGHVASWNAGAQRIKGYLPEEIIGKHFSVFYPPEDLEKPGLELQIAERDGTAEDEGWRLRKDGSRFWADVLITAVRDGKGKLRGFAKVTRDVTDRRAAEETRQALVEQREARLLAEEERSRVEASFRVAQESNRAKDEFLMTLSHELRTPMTSIVGWARLLPSLDPSDEMFREAVSSIGRSAQLQSHLIDDVLDVSRIVSGKLRLNIEETGAVEVLTAAIDAVRPAADARSITITPSFHGEIGTIAVDSTRLQQVVWNLLTNAIKFTPHHGTIGVDARRTESHLEIDVSDSGEGIEPDFLRHVFEPFRQAEDPETRVHGGLGLGLSIVRYIVEAHGGTISAESEGRGKGAKFSVRLPVSAAASSEVEPGVTQAHSNAPVRPISTDSLKGLKILVVDDDPSGRGVVRAVLEHAGAQVTAVESAALAMQQLGANTFDLVITDIAMPSMNGYDLAQEIRRQPALTDLKLIALTAFPSGKGSAGADAGAFDVYLMKPIDPADLVESVASLLGGDRASALK